MEKDLALIEQGLTTAHLSVLTDMILGVYKETLPAEQYDTLRRNFYTRLYHRQSEALKGLKGIVSDRLLMKAEFDLMSAKDQHAL